MNEQLIKLIELCLMDGVISDKEREVIFKKSKKLGVDEDECEIILEGMIQEKEKLTKNSNSTNISVKSDNSDGFKPKKVPKSVLIDLNNSEKLLEEKEKLKTKNDNLTNDNKLLNKEISDNIKQIKDNSLIYINSLKFNEEFFQGYVVSDIITDMEEVDLYKTEV